MQEIYTDDIGSGFPLILVHGYLGSSEMWKFQKDYLSKNFRIISPALPGFGESHKAKSLNSINLMASFIINEIDKNPFKRGPSLAIVAIGYTTLQSLMNAKLSPHRFWPFHENGLIKTIQTIPHNLYVSFKSASLYCGLG